MTPDPKSSRRGEWQALGLAILCIAGAACSDSTGPAAIAPSVLSVDVGADSNSLIRTLEFETSSAVGVQIDYWAPTTPRLRVTQFSPTTGHSVYLPGLRAGLVYDYEVRPIAQGLASPVIVKGQVTTDPLPADLSQITFAAAGRPTARLTMLELRGTPFAGYVIVDQSGAVVWYHRGVAESFTRRANGDFVVLENSVGLTELTPDQTVVAHVPFVPGQLTMHHDVIATPDNTLLFLAQDTATFAGEVWVGDAIWEWSPEAGTVVRRWRARDFLSPDLDFGPKSVQNDWLHANSLSLGPRGNVLISLPALNQIISIAADFQSLEWRLGGPRATIVPDAGDDFWFEHAAAEISPGRVLLFDNGRDRPEGLFSRALELKLDLATGTASKTWEFRPQPTIYAPIIGSARRFGNGNTLVDFGTRSGVLGSSGPISIFETTPGGFVTWVLRISGGELLNYRATALEDIGGEVVVRRAGGDE